LFGASQKNEGTYVEREKGLVKLFLSEFVLRTGSDQILFTKFGKIDLVI
jgi:hypothetical protein